MEVGVLSEDEQRRRQRAKKMLLYLGVFSITMLFAGLTSGYVVALNGKFWVNIKLPRPFYISTVLILVSSLTMWLAVRSARQNKVNLVRLFVAVTLILGVGFTYSQVKGWSALTHEGMYLRSFVDNLKGQYGKDYTLIYKGTKLIKQDGKYYFPDDYYHDHPLNEEIAVYSNEASSFLFVLTALHVAHLAGGLIALIVILILALLGRINSERNFSLRQTAVYWHFLDILWVYLFLFLSFIH